MHFKDCLFLVIGFGITYCVGSLDRCPKIVQRTDLYKTTFNNLCYIFVNYEQTWVDARERCWSWGGEMITIKNQETMNFVKGQLDVVLRWKNNGVWIGAHARESVKWKWTNGEELRYGYWADGEPSKSFLGISFEDCALMRRGDGWRWHDYHCDSSTFFKYKSICQFRMRPLPTTTSTPVPSTTSTPVPNTTSTPVPNTTSTPVPTTSVSSTMGVSTAPYQSATSVLPMYTPVKSVNLTEGVNLTLLSPDLVISPDHNVFQSIHGTKYHIAAMQNHIVGSSSSVSGDDDSDKSKDIGIIAGIIIGGLILILIMVVGTLLLRRRQRKKYTEEPSVHFQNLSYSHVSQNGQDPGNVYMDTNEMNRLYEEVNKQVNHGVNSYGGTMIRNDLSADGGDVLENGACCGGGSEVCCSALDDCDPKKCNFSAGKLQLKNDFSDELDENQYVDMSNGTQPKSTNLLLESKRVVDPNKPSNLNRDREPMPLPVYANSQDDLQQSTREPASLMSTLSHNSTYVNSQESFAVDEEGYMSPLSTLSHNNETDVKETERDPLYDEVQ